MKHMIYTRPAVEKQLANFKCDQNLKSELSGLIENGFCDLRILRIESEKGNGSSHLLQALANELRRKRERTAYLSFWEGDRFSDLDHFLLKDLLNTPFLFIDDLPVMLLAHSHTDFLDFLRSIAAHNGVLFYSSSNPGDQEEIRTISNCFDEKGLTLTLSPLEVELRKNWAVEILGEEHINEISEDIFSNLSSNQSFLESLEPIQQKIQRMNGLDYAFNQDYIRRINSHRLHLRQSQLRLAEIQIEKDACIRKQLYESAADLREREKSILREIEILEQEVLKMQQELPFIPTQLDLHYKTTVLLHQIRPEKSVLDELNILISQRMHTLNAHWEQLKDRKETFSNRKVIEELRDWEEAIVRFNVMNKKRPTHQ